MDSLGKNPAFLFRVMEYVWIIRNYCHSVNRTKPCIIKIEENWEDFEDIDQIKQPLAEAYETQAKTYTTCAKRITNGLLNIF